VFFQALGMEIQRYRNVCCALTDQEPVAGLIIYSLCKKHCAVVKFRSEIKVWNKARDKGKKEKTGRK
jgi:hypothetical protein